MNNRDSNGLDALPTLAEVIDLLAAVIAVVLLALNLLNMGGTVRLLLAAVFTLFIPGRAIVSNWPRMAGWSNVGMSIVFSLGLLILLATLALWAKLWHPVGLFDVEALLSLIGLGVAAIRRRLAPDLS